MYLLFIIVPLLSLIVLNLPFRPVMKKMAFWWLSALLVLQIFLVMGYVFKLLPHDLNLSIYPAIFNLHIDRLACVALLSIGMVLGTSLLAGKYFIREEEKFFNFVSLLLIILAGMNGIAMVMDIFSLYVFMEIVAVASFILISFYKDKPALESVFKYIILSAVATVMMLLSIALLFFISGNTEFSAIQAALKNSPHNFIVIFAIGMFICALFIKGGLVPFHGWLPEVYASAPAPVSVLLAGVVTKMLGVFILIRMAISVIGFSHSMNQVFLFVGALSIVVGALAALGQSDFKRMLAYSSISQVGYILIGIGSGSALGILGAVFHLFNHSVFKSTLFVNSAALELQTGTRNINKMAGLASKMPITAVTSVISSLSTAGLPPLAGFWSKLLIVLALWLSGNYVYALVAVTASIITLAYFILMLRKVFFGNNMGEEFANVKEAGFSLLFPACLLSGINIGLGLAFPLLLKLLNFR